MSFLAVTASSHSSASAAIVYAALLDAESWPLWSAYADVEWDVPAGVDRPARVDDLRTIRSRIGRVCCRERVVEMVPGRRFSYEQAAGLFTSHRGSVDLTRAPPMAAPTSLGQRPTGTPSLSWTCSGAGVYRFGSTISRHTPTQP
ncbi:SRPBCC family protein [Streptomyces sp. YIM 132580]|uniref:SRPBCC family protein n=1 Tax=Streptomyces sp. YIM 132580 TaxID=2691958 RepID=UPI001371DD9B